MKSIFISVVLLGATATSVNTWQVGQGEVRVTCSMTIGGSFDVTTTALNGSVASASGGSQALDGNLAVDLRTLETGIGLRNRHLRENYLEVDKAPGFETATLASEQRAALAAVSRQAGRTATESARAGAGAQGA
jgi:hypothetical protein